MKAEQRERLRQKHAQKYPQRLELVREETRSETSSRRSRRSHRSHRDHRDRTSRALPPLSEANLHRIAEDNEIATQYNEPVHGEARYREQSPSVVYRNPYVETEIEPQPGLIRRHTDFIETGSQMTYQDTLPPPSRLHRRNSDPEMRRRDIDMNLAYGELPPHLIPRDPYEEEQELNSMVSRVEKLLLEAHCLHHSATAIMAGLQENPDAMAAVALTLAELSNLLAKVSPGLIGLLKSSSPAIFALLASPQFLIGTGVALGVTVIMFGGFKIIKKIQGNAAQKQAIKMEADSRIQLPMGQNPMLQDAAGMHGPLPEAITYDEELSSIECWRRGIADVEAESVATSADGEFITPGAERLKKERIRERAREERRSTVAPSVVSTGTSRRNGQHLGTRSRARSESGRTEKSSRPRKDITEILSKEKKSKNPLTLLFKKDRDSRGAKDQDMDSERSRRRRKNHNPPRVMEIA